MTSTEGNERQSGDRSFRSPGCKEVAPARENHTVFNAEADRMLGVQPSHVVRCMQWLVELLTRNDHGRTTTAERPLLRGSSANPRQGPGKGPMVGGELLVMHILTYMGNRRDA